MLKAGLSYEDVAAVATVLAEIGQEVSVNSVRRHLGTGSRFIIGRHLARWRSEQSAGIADAGGEEDGAETPPPPTASLTHALESLGNAFQVATETQIRPLEERVHVLSDELGTLREGLAQGEGRTSDQLGALALELRSGDKGLKRKIEQLGKHLEGLEQRIDEVASAWQTQSAELGAKIARMAQEHTALMAELLARLDGLSSAHDHLMQSLRDHQHSGQNQIAALEQRLVSLSDSVLELVPRGEAEKPRKKKE